MQRKIDSCNISFVIQWIKKNGNNETGIDSKRLVHAWHGTICKRYVHSHWTYTHSHTSYLHTFFQWTNQGKDLCTLRTYVTLMYFVCLLYPLHTYSLFSSFKTALVLVDSVFFFIILCLFFFFFLSVNINLKIQCVLCGAGLKRMKNEMIKKIKKNKIIWRKFQKLSLYYLFYFSTCFSRNVSRKHSVQGMVCIHLCIRR